LRCRSKVCIVDIYILNTQIIFLVASLLKSPQPCGVRGRVSDASGQGIANAQIEVVDPRGEPVFSDGSGAYCLPPVAADRPIQLLITADGYQDQLSPSIVARGGVEAQVDIT